MGGHNNPEDREDLKQEITEEVEDRRNEQEFQGRVEETVEQDQEVLEELKNRDQK